MDTVPTFLEHGRLTRYLTCPSVRTRAWAAFPQTERGGTLQAHGAVVGEKLVL